MSTSLALTLVALIPVLVAAGLAVRGARAGRATAPVPVRVRTPRR